MRGKKAIADSIILRYGECDRPNAAQYRNSTSMPHECDTLSNAHSRKQLHSAACSIDRDDTGSRQSNSDAGGMPLLMRILHTQRYMHKSLTENAALMRKTKNATVQTPRFSLY